MIVYKSVSKKPRAVQNVFIGANSTILHGVKIGEESLVAACSLVIDDVPERTVVGGVPAKVLKRLKEVTDDTSI
jgi:acetyltransferase-like isoleucine patch superfamily enzyme